MDDVTFSDQKKRNNWFRTQTNWFSQPDDVIVAIGQPYMSHMAFD
jgi:hypothetical protein